MIEMRDAVKIAIDFVVGAYRPQQLLDVLLEEIERSQDDEWWLVTIGFRSLIPKSANPPPESALFAFERRQPRDFKVVEVHSRTGQVRSMKNKAA